MNKTTFNPLSQSSYFVISRFNETVLSKATCFFIKRNSKTYLITNWHVVSGRNSETKECLSNTCGIPNNLLIQIHKNQDTIDFENFEIPLNDENNKNLWFEHPQFSSNVDVVAIEVIIPDNLSVFDIEMFIEPFNENTNESIANDVFIIGYPFGKSEDEIFPIWKRASIASEPCINIEGLPKMLVDTASRNGMSGSPVILYEKRSTAIIEGDPTVKGGITKISHYFMKLVGVYSGRIGVDDKNIKAQLGIVWKSNVINEIISQTIDAKNE
jgi:hypothetical protein